MRDHLSQPTYNILYTMRETKKVGTKSEALSAIENRSCIPLSTSLDYNGTGVKQYIGVVKSCYGLLQQLFLSRDKMKDHFISNVRIDDTGEFARVRLSLNVIIHFQSVCCCHKYHRNNRAMITDAQLFQRESREEQIECKTTNHSE